MLPSRPNFSLSPRLLRLLFLLLVLIPLSILLLSFLHSSHTNHLLPRTIPGSTTTTALNLFLSLSATANSSISSHLRSLTLQPHLSGTPAASSAASYVRSHLDLAGLQTLTRNYSALLSYPSSASLHLLHPNGTLIKPLSLTEPADPGGRAVPPYHSYSPSGSAVAPAVYANLGRDEDYLTLDRLSVNVRGCVVLVRKGGGRRGDTVEKAAERGAKAVIMFANGHGGGVERGTVLLGGAGDPLTPGWAATAAAERLPVEDSEVRSRFPRIPSLPVSSATADEILRSLGGAPAPEEWRRDAPAVVGVGGGSTLLNFTYQEDRKLAEIQNIISIMKGYEEPDRYVILGNHRDAWTYGAVDPNSGTSVLLDVASRLGALLRSGWSPKRTIILCSWDAEEFGMIGSTEWLEQNLGNLGSRAVAYLNLDCAVQGPGFFAGTTPQLDKLLIEIMKLVGDPDSESLTVYQTWVARNGGISIERLSRADSDFTAFLHHAGIPATDIYFGEDYPFYHTILDTYEWMTKHGDPSFRRHVATSEIWGLLALRLADDLILPFDYISYANQLQEHANSLAALLGSSQTIDPIYASILEFTAAANEAVEETKRFEEQGLVKDVASCLRLRAFNDRLMLVERAFLEAEGLQGRPWFKHMLYSPPKDSASRLSFFPGVADAISDGLRSTEEGRSKIDHEIWRVARAIERAAAALRGELA